ncbi:glycosyl hydrolase catalytic core-domain-containing protein [Vararia minispora EC-137]|uniref:Glycosyl hydrolase catalytic core-domain-containing protein n=1 Tax=Vararia minispora EC-137 TaxID=1314806 RepID=A0ACB8QWS1_9AGAM|nr:glycosyl hydrolase catalytic core-domain-containing protein [Vararia minispora EC-137]
MLTKSSLLASVLFATSALAGKRGLAWPWYNSPLDPGVLNNGFGEVVAIYDWETYSPPSSTGGLGGLGWIGMQGCKDCSSSPVSQLAARHAQYGWATVFSVNEPDMPGTSNSMSPSEAAGWYKQWINPLAIKKALPAISSSSSAGQGLDWLQQMVSACAGGCYYDYINLHWYGTSFSEFQAYVNRAHSIFPNNQIVITEFALTNPSGGQSAQVAFFRSAFQWLDSVSWVELYFPFVATSPSLLTAHGNGAASFVGTGSCLYTDAGGPSAVGNLMYDGTI